MCCIGMVVSVVDLGNVLELFRSGVLDSIEE